MLQRHLYTAGFAVDIALALMQSFPARFAAIAAIGLIAPLWWSWLASQLTYGIFIVAGSLERPSVMLAWASILLPSLVLGFGVGFGIGLFSARPIVGWLVFLVGLVIGSVLLGSLAALRDLTVSPGSWAFVLSALAGSMLSVRANNSFKPKPLRGST